MKLVTRHRGRASVFSAHFNPHEREARDKELIKPNGKRNYFNPHEREARDRGAILRILKITDFNPHAREARDDSGSALRIRRTLF